MEKTKTVVSELIEKLKQSDRPIDFLIWFQDKNNQQKILQTEKEQLINAHADGQLWMSDNEQSWEYVAKEWFDKKFESHVRST